MIRKLILSSLLLGIAAGTYAQEIKHNLFHLSPRQIKNRQMVSNFLRNNPPTRLAHKPTAIKQRVIAQAFHYADGSVDSTKYTYSGTNGSAYDYNNFYDLLYSVNFAPEMKPVFVHPYFRPSTDVMADQQANYSNSEIFSQVKAFYTAGRLDSTYGHYGPGDADDYYLRTYYDYSGSDQMGALTEHQSDDDVTYMPNTRQEFTYSGPTRVTGDSTFYYVDPEWTFSFENIYHYNDAGFLDTLLFQGDRLVFTYDGEGRLSTIKGYNLFGGDPEHFVTDSIGYTTGIDYATYFHEVNYYEGMTDGTRMIKYPGEGGKLDSIVVYDFDEGVWIKSGVAKYNYNSFGNPETIVADEDGEDIAMVRFYYEEYDDGLSLPEITNSKMFNIHPNPFINNLTINYTGKDARSAVSWKLTDITGRHIIDGTLALQQGDNKIDIPEIAPGNYIITLKDASGKAWSSKLVKR